jgi:hypothetical protein
VIFLWQLIGIRVISARETIHHDFGLTDNGADKVESGYNSDGMMDQDQLF